MERYDLIIIGAGPSGLSAAIEAAGKGMHVCVFDENAKPGGQLFKQIHKFFGSKEHMAKIRGFQIGIQLLEQARKLNVKVFLSATVLGIYENHVVSVQVGEEIINYRGDNVILATGASEKMLPFDGWTLPGVIGAGAAQTMMNLHGIMPGQEILMVGSGNVGLVVSYQLEQAGCHVKGIVDVAPEIGGYGVHAAKITRMGIPFFMSHTIKSVQGVDHVEKVIIGQVDEKWHLIPETEKEFVVDTVCIAVGLNPMSQLAKIAGCQMIDKGGLVPVSNEDGETTIEGIFVAGDVAGIEEASSAMITGRIAANGALFRSGYITQEEKNERRVLLNASLDQLRQGMFAKKNRGHIITETEEGYPLSENLKKKGFIEEKELLAFPNVSVCQPVGIHPIIECTQNIPCNPCQDACKIGCIEVGESISHLPIVDVSKKCIGCGMCVASCSGQAIFLLDQSFEAGFASIAMPYEMLPCPSKGDIGIGLDRRGREVCEVEVVSIKSSVSFDKTKVLTIKVPLEMANVVRCFRPKEA